MCHNYSDMPTTRELNKEMKTAAGKNMNHDWDDLKQDLLNLSAAEAGTESSR